MLTLVIWERPSAAAAGTAAAASSAAGPRLGSAGPAAHGDRGQQLHGVIVPLGARTWRRRLAHRAAAFERGSAGAAAGFTARRANTARRAGSRERVTKEGGAVKGEWGGGSASSCRAWQDSDNSKKRARRSRRRAGGYGTAGRRGAALPGLRSEERATREGSAAKGEWGYGVVSAGS